MVYIHTWGCLPDSLVTVIAMTVAMVADITTDSIGMMNPSISFLTGKPYSGDEETPPTADEDTEKRELSGVNYKYAYSETSILRKPL